VTQLTGVYAGGTVTWTWTLPDGLAKADVTYSYEATNPSDTTRGSVEEATVSVDAVAGENCMEISTVSRSSGRMSDPMRACVTVP
jgi:putative serine/threonine-protein kinase pknK